jgi:ABC-2 type transport system ATP-binding protein
MANLIQITEVSKSYYGKTVLENVSLGINGGVFYALLGKNGAGKSTLMRILMRHEAPDSGGGLAFGVPFSGNDQGVNHQIGYVSEMIELHSQRRIGDFYKSYGKFFRSWDQTLFEGFIQKFKVDPMKRFHELSRGQKMQVVFSAAVAVQPKVLFLDEITSVLDASARAYVMDFLGGFCRSGGAVVMATNLVSEVERHVDHIWWLDNKRILINQAVKDLKGQYVKLRRMLGEDHAVFHRPHCVSVGLNSDGSESYVMVKQKFDAARPENAEALFDRRVLSAEELFIFLTRDRSVVS